MSKYRYTKILQLFSGYAYMIFIKDKQMLCFNLGLTPTIPETESVSDKGSSPCWSDYLQEEASVLREALLAPHLSKLY